MGHFPHFSSNNNELLERESRELGGHSKSEIEKRVIVLKE
jgi:hypothetical protein